MSLRLYPEGFKPDEMTDDEAFRRMAILNSGSFTPGGVNILGLVNLALEAINPSDLWDAIRIVGERLNEMDILEPETKLWVKHFQDEAIGSWRYKDMDGEPWDPILVEGGMMDYHKVNGTVYTMLIVAVLLTQTPGLLSGLGRGIKQAMALNSKRKTAAFRDETLEGIDAILSALGDNAVFPNDNTAKIEKITQALKSNNVEGLFAPLGRLRV